MTRFNSQKSQSLSLPLFNQSIQLRTDTNPTVQSILSMGVPVYSNTRGGAVDAGDVPVDSLPVLDLATTRDSRQAILKERRSADRIEEVLGALPILLVDDSVSILKMTKRAIHNECANIR